LSYREPIEENKTELIQQFKQNNMLKKTTTLAQRLEAEIERKRPATTCEKIQEIRLMLSAYEEKPIPKKPAVTVTVKKPAVKVKNAFRKIQFKGIEQRSFSNPKNRK
jgi:hypothetical protein